jgi:UDP-N-acetylglucosamine 4,6-dehydratase
MAMAEKNDYFKGKIVLVTGGAGSIGRELCKELLAHGVSALRVLDNNETGLFELVESLSDTRIRALVGDIRDKDRLKKALNNVDIVFHAAALKHVPFCEYNAFEAMATNVIGTQNVIDAAIDENVKKFVMISTDKAVDPFNVMGVTKLLAEKLTISVNRYRTLTAGAFFCVRFGNVLGSRGSVIPSFKEQIRTKNRITITDRNMTRFIMKTSDAVSLVMKATVMAEGGEIFILKMPALNLMDLTKAIIEGYAPKCGLAPAKVKIEIIGRRPGEKNHEALLGVNEVEYAFELEDMFVMLPLYIEKLGNLKYNNIFKLKPKKVRSKSYSSKTARKLSKTKIREMIDPLLD